mmetsp:Transcript_34445/g.41208  ORF Transcript_34445/g.41208 Transcript_34445/m.41208 type:complete len:135 (+) Transcript_34445:1-405(+)
MRARIQASKSHPTSKTASSSSTTVTTTVATTTAAVTGSIVESGPSGRSQTPNTLISRDSPVTPIVRNTAIIDPGGDISNNNNNNNNISIINNNTNMPNTTTRQRTPSPNNALGRGRGYKDLAAMRKRNSGPGAL